MRLSTIKSSKITWTIYLGDSWNDFTEQYCADGDGMVVVKTMRDGGFVLEDQGDVLASFDDVGTALEAAQDRLESDYPCVFEESQT